MNRKKERRFFTTNILLDQFKESGFCTKYKYIPYFRLCKLELLQK